MLRLYRDAYAGLPRPVWLLAFSAFINRAGTMVVPFLGLYFTTRLGIDIGDVGVLLAVFGCGALVGSYAGGALVDRLGPVPVQAGSMLATAAGMLVLQRVEDPVALGALLLLLGACAEAFRPANNAHVAAIAPADRVGKAFALNRLAINLGWAAGPSFGGIIARVDYAYLFWINAATAVLTAVFLLAVFGRLEARHARATAGAAAPSPWRDREFLCAMLLTGIGIVVFLQTFGIVPVFLAEHYGLLEDRIGLLMALNPVLIVVFEMVLVHALRWRPPLPWIACGVLLTGAGVALLPLGTGVGLAVLAVVVWTLGEMLAMPLTATFVSMRAVAANRGRYMGVYALSGAIGFVVAPAGMRVYAAFGERVLFFGCALACVLAALGLVLLHRAGRARRSVEREAEDDG